MTPQPPQPKRRRADYSNGSETVLRALPSCDIDQFGVQSKFSTAKLDWMPACGRDSWKKCCIETSHSQKMLYPEQLFPLPQVDWQQTGYVRQRIDPRLATKKRSIKNSVFTSSRLAHTRVEQHHSAVTTQEKKYNMHEVVCMPADMFRQTGHHESRLCNYVSPGMGFPDLGFGCFVNSSPGHFRGSLPNTQWSGEAVRQNHVIPERVLLNKTCKDRRLCPRTILIDGIEREIRFYGEQPVVLISDDDPRLISFMPGWRRIFFSNLVINLEVGGDYQDIVLNGYTCKIKIGYPTREVYINGIWYECLFGGNPVTIKIGEQLVKMSMEGPPPSVHIGNVRNLDYLAGRIFIGVDATWVAPVYLDEQPQHVDLGGRMVNLQFEDSLRFLVIDGLRYPANFGGLPMQIAVGGHRVFIRLPPLPQYVKPGMVFQRKSEAAVPSRTFIVPKKEDVGRSSPVDVKELLLQLVEKGLLPPAVEDKSNENFESEQKTKVTASEKDGKSIRAQIAPVIKMLYEGKQCGTCGLRFPAHKAEQYTEHLDWHFRENRRKKAVSTKSQSRPWYESKSVWIQFEELEETKPEAVFEKTEVSTCTEETSFSSVVVGCSSEDNKCHVCLEDFDQFYNEENEEWHLKNAIRIDGLTFHHSCYPDYAKNLQVEVKEE